MGKQHRATREPELLIAKTRRALMAAFLEKQRARAVWKLSERGKLPLLPSLAGSLDDANMELMVAAKRLACLQYCLDVELLWMNSAWAMYEALRPPDTHEVIPWFPEGHYWIEYETPRQTPAGEMAALLLIDRTEIALEAFSALLFEEATRPGSAGQLSPARAVAKAKEIRKHREEYPLSAGSNLVEVSVVDTNGAIPWSVYLKLFAEQGSIGWAHNWGYRCPTGECDLLEQELGEEAPNCATCQATFEYFLEWLGIAHSMLRGDFRETEQEGASPESIVVTERGEAAEGVRDSKARTRQREHRMYVIRFDASMKRIPPESRGKRGAWMSGRPVVQNAYEADRNAIIFVQMQFKAHDRTFRHERYRAARDTSRHFPSKVHQQRLTVREYKARLEAGEVSDDGIFRAKQARSPRRLRVEARKYEQATDSS